MSRDLSRTEAGTTQNDEHGELVWPRLFIPGVPKAGTTSLHRYLSQHPGISMSREKEPDFFTTGMSETEGDPEAREAAIQAYMDQFDDDGALVRGEASCSYFTWPEAPERIAQRVPDARFVFSLRDPVDRAYSYYLMEHRANALPGSFLEEVRTALAGEGTTLHRRLAQQNLYHTNISRFIDTFGRESLKIILFDDLVEAPRREVRSIVEFLELDPEPVHGIEVGKKHNPYRGHRGPIARFLRHDDRAKRLARKLLPLKVREFIGDKLLLRKGDKPPMEPEAAELIWEQVAGEIEAMEALLGRALPELRKHA